MGTDIHMGLELKLDNQYYYPNGTGDEVKLPWVAIRDYYPDSYWHSIYYNEPDNETAARYFLNDRVYSSRNYVTFAVLGDVRNGYGFAGTPTHTPLTPSVGAGRGLPDDRDPRPEGQEGWYYGDHSFGWITIDELEDYPFKQDVVLADGTTHVPLQEACGVLLDAVELIKSRYAPLTTDRMRLIYGFDS